MVTVNLQVTVKSMDDAIMLAEKINSKDKYKVEKAEMYGEECTPYYKRPVTYYRWNDHHTVTNEEEE